jgi:hypothetical protein
MLKFAIHSHLHATRLTKETETLEPQLDQSHRTPASNLFMAKPGADGKEEINTQQQTTKKTKNQNAS